MLYLKTGCFEKYEIFIVMLLKHHFSTKIHKKAYRILYLFQGELETSTWPYEIYINKSVRGFKREPVLLEFYLV